MDEREICLNTIKELEKIAKKKHSLTSNTAQKLDFFLAGLQLKAIVENEHKFEDNELLAMVENYFRVKETKVKAK